MDRMNLLNTILLNLSIKAKNFFTDEEGDVNIVSIVVLIGIAVILAIAFKDAIIDILESLFGGITGSTDELATETASF